MPEFSYTARAQGGQTITGKIDALSADAAQSELSQKGFIVTKIKESKGGSALGRIKNWNSGVKPKYIVIFARQLSVLISATVPIVRSLRILSEQTESKILQPVIAQLADDVDAGTRLSTAMSKHKKVFDDFFIYMIRAGETTGRLDEVLVYLADQKEKDYELRSKTISALIYPAFILVVMIVIFAFMMGFVVPKLLDLVLQGSSDTSVLPITTRVLIVVSNVFQNYWWLMLIIVGVLAGAFAIANRQEASRKYIDLAKLYIPIMGKIFRMTYLTRISRSMASLLSSGVTLNRSIEIIADLVGNRAYKEILVEAQKEVEDGKQLSGVLAESKQMPMMMTQMMAIGEETGRVDQIMNKVADFYMSQVEALTDALTSLIEPLILVILGIGASILVTGIMLPIFQLSQGGY